jgi:hypothetical protein
MGTLLVGAAAFSGARPAQAQEAELTRERPFAVKVGAFLPADEFVRKASGHTLFAIEGQYLLQDINSGGRLSSQTLINVGYAGRNRFAIAPITLSQIFRDPRQGPGRGTYVGFGFGIYITRLEVNDATEDEGDLDADATTTSGDTKSLLGGFVVAGLNMGRGFVEAKYHVVNTYERKQVDGLQLTAGARF